MQSNEPDESLEQQKLKAQRRSARQRNIEDRYKYSDYIDGDEKYTRPSKKELLSEIEAALLDEEEL